MERLVLIVQQLEESKRFIQIDDIAHLRMALLLLDNASEVLMYRAVTDALGHDDLYSRMFSSAKKWMPKEEFEKFEAESAYKLIPPKTRKAVQRYYDEKVDFLVERRELEDPVGRVLKSLHRYRNEAYHRDIVRKATIRPAVILLFELTCHLLKKLKPNWMSYSSKDNWGEFCKSYNLDSPLSVTDGGLEKIVAQLRDSMTLGVGDLARLLSEHLHNRLEDMKDSLQFIIENTTGTDDLEDELKLIQFWKKFERLPISSEDQKEYELYRPRYLLEDFTKWAQATRGLARQTEKLEIFNKFSEIETELEPLEEMISEVAALIDQAIQAEIDRALGK